MKYIELVLLAWPLSAFLDFPEVIFLTILTVSDAVCFGFWHSHWILAQQSWDVYTWKLATVKSPFKVRKSLKIINSRAKSSVVPRNVQCTRRIHYLSQSQFAPVLKRFLKCRHAVELDGHDFDQAINSMWRNSHSSLRSFLWKTA